MIQVIIVMLFSLTLLFSEPMHEKLIISGDNDIVNAQAELLKLKSYFIENPEISLLQEKHKLILEMEVLGDYALVVIKPVETEALKSELLTLLKPLFPELFSIKYQEVECPDVEIDAKTNVESMKNLASPVKVEKSQYYQFLVEEIGLQWLALLLLAVIGLTLSVHNRRKLVSLEKTQKELSIKQDQIEDEINKLGVSSV